MELDAKRIALSILRHRLQREISNIQIESKADESEFLSKCCTVLLQDPEYCLVWVGRQDAEGTLKAITTAVDPAFPAQECQELIAAMVREGAESTTAFRALYKEKPVIIGSFSFGNDTTPIGRLNTITGSRSYASLPLLDDQYKYGVLTVHSTRTNGFTGPELDFIVSVAATITQSLHLRSTSQSLRLEHDFNCEIVQTVQALLISLSPCGEILSFNPTAETVTGFTEDEVKGKYWVDVLISPDKRASSQKQFSFVLKEGTSEMNFQAELQTRNGEKRIIDWHGSIRPDFDQGRVGVVLFGIDITGKMAADRALNHALDKWENIFSSMQDPALIVSEQGRILDINPATAAAARVRREDIIGKGVCEVLHGGRSPGAICPLETLLREKKSRIFETELRGLRGNYLLTVNPLRHYDGKSAAALLLARDLTEEQLMKAEAFRAAQLASVGELAAGVAHEINNPINGIINYAQILLDSNQISTNSNFLQCIIKEGQRIAGITKNLLDFSRKREESPEPANIITLFKHCIELIQHQYLINGIALAQEYDPDLPLVFCNPQQIQQVFLNVFSNARYALNQRYPGPDENKRIVIKASIKTSGGRDFVRSTITDYGTGIEHDLMDRVMDPFFSTKAKGEGTGLGLSISHSLIQENMGHFRIQSEWGRFTTVIIDLPVAQGNT